MSSVLKKIQEVNVSLYNFIETGVKIDGCVVVSLVATLLFES